MKKVSKLVVASLVLSCCISTSCFAVSNCFANTKQTCSKQIVKDEKVPSRVYRMVKLDKGVSTKYSDEMKEIINLVWNEPNGRLILNALSKEKVKIKIVNTEGRVFASEEDLSISYSPSTANQGDTYKLFYITVAVPVEYISDFANVNLPLDKRIYSLGYIIHEFAHAFVYAKDPHNVNSIEQKLTLTMFGYNEASKILTGKYLSKEESVSYSYIALKSIVDYETKKCPIYSGITKKIAKYGITLQNTEDYSDINSMYKKLLSEGKIKPNEIFKIK